MVQPGVAAASWYLIAVSLPGLGHLIAITAAGLTPFNLGALPTWESLAAIIFIAAPTAGTITAAAIAGVPLPANKSTVAAMLAGRLGWGPGGG